MNIKKSVSVYLCQRHERFGAQPAGPIEIKVSLRHEIQTQKGSKERLFIMTGTHKTQIFGEIPFVKAQKKTLKQQLNG